MSAHEPDRAPRAQPSGSGSARPENGIRPLAARLLARPWLEALLPLLLVLLVGALFSREGVFFEWGTHRAMLREISVHGILACGMTVVIVSAGIDLSVGSVLGLAAVLFALGSMPLGLGGPASIALTLSVAATAGLISGLLVAVAEIQSFIVTLAMMVFTRGLAKELSGGRKVTNYLLNADGSSTLLDYPSAFRLLDAKVLGGNLAVVTLVFVACAALTHLLLTRLRVGRYLYAVGGNATAARLSGVPVRRTLIFAYAYAGLLSGIAGLCQAAQETQGDPETGMGYELDAIAIVVLGGTSLRGGRGSIPRTLLGALTLGYLQKILSLNAFSSEARLMLTGAIIIGAVLFQRRLQR